MSLKLHIAHHRLKFNFAAGTSRGVLREKDTYFIRVFTEDQPYRLGYGEIPILPGLSVDEHEDIPAVVQKIGSRLFTVEVPENYAQILDILEQLVAEKLPSVRFGLETALLDWLGGGKQLLFDNAFSSAKAGIHINGLIWMGEEDFLKQQVNEKLAAGFKCIKLKVGALDFDKELEILSHIRALDKDSQLMLRVDANGAFTRDNAMEKLEKLSQFNLHSIEQPVPAHEHETLAWLAEKSPIPIGLDESLIGIKHREDKFKLLQAIKPPFIILKPGLLGGLEATAEWISLANDMGIGWWITSALEANIGLNAICQFSANFKLQGPQGLGTGALYQNNVKSPLEVKNGMIFSERAQDWDFSTINFI